MVRRSFVRRRLNGDTQLRCKTCESGLMEVIFRNLVSDGTRRVLARCAKCRAETTLSVLRIPEAAYGDAGESFDPRKELIRALTMNEAEAQAIRQALDATKGNVMHAAKLLGIGRTTLYRKLKTIAP